MKGEAIEELHMQMDGVRREGQIERKRNLEEGVREERGIYIYREREKDRGERGRVGRGRERGRE